MFKIKNNVRFGAVVIIQGNIEVPKKILLVSHNGSNYDYHFIIIE